MNTFIAPGDRPVPLADEQRAQRKASIVTALVLVLMFAGAFMLWLAHRAEETDALREIAPEHRRELFESTRHTLTTVCAPGVRPAGLDAYCRDQAAFLLKFEQCDASCRALAERSRPPPTR